MASQDDVMLTQVLVWGAWWQEPLTSCVQRHCHLPPLRCLDVICTLPSLGPSGSLQAPVSALPSCRAE